MSGTIINVVNGNVYLKQINNIIQYSFDNITYNDISWPFTVGRNPSYTNIITVYIVNNLTITDISQYLIVNTNNITFNGYYNSLYQIITLNINSYNGLIQNGSGEILENTINIGLNQNVNTLSVTSSINGYNNINIFNINIQQYTYLTKYNGYLCQSFFGYNSTNNNIYNCKVQTDIIDTPNSDIWVGQIAGVFCNFSSISYCNSNNSIYKYSSGILGSYSICTNISNCYSLGSLYIYGGGIVGCFHQSNLNIINCYNNGDVYNMSGGIIGPNFGYSTTNILNVSNCYNKGNCENSSYTSAIVGGSIYYYWKGDPKSPTNIPANKPIINVNNCYMTGSIATLDDAFVSTALDPYITSKSITNCYYTNNNPWNDTEAKSILDNSLNAWIYPDPPNNTPYILTSLKYLTPPFPYELSYQYKYVYVGSNITLSVTYVGSAPVYCNWYLNGVLIPNINTNKYNIINAKLTQDGKYTCKLYNNIGYFTYTMYLNVVPTTYTIIVGTMISINQDINTGNISCNGQVIQNWPVMVIGNNYKFPFVYCKFSNGITLTNSNQYFVAGQANVSISDNTIVPSKENVIKITLNIPNNTPYDGLFQNGTSTKDGYDNCSAYNINIIGNAKLNDYAGFICQKYWSKNSRPGIIVFVYSNIEISGEYSGGIVGAYSTPGPIENCYSSGDITGNYAGGIIGAYLKCKDNTLCNKVYSLGEIRGNNSGGLIGAFTTMFSTIYGNNYKIVQNVFSSGNITGLNSGGIIGSDIGNGNISSNLTVELEYCYTLGNISDAAGGLIGGLNIKKTNNLNVQLFNCYTNGKFNNNNGLIAVSMNNSINKTLNNVYIANNNWSNSVASNTLNVNNNWITYQNNIPYILSNLDTIITVTVSPQQILILGQNMSIYAYANGTSPIIYQWQYSIDNSNYVNININGNNNIYSISNIVINNSGYYRCIVSNSLNTVISSYIKVNVLTITNPIITNISPNVVSKIGQTITVFGKNFNIRCIVKFAVNGGSLVNGANINFINSSAINVNIPVITSGILYVTVTNLNTNEISLITDNTMVKFISLPDYVHNIQATSSNSSAVLIWDKSILNDNISYYVLNCSDNTIPSVSTNNNYVVFPGLINNSIYTFTAFAINSYGISSNISYPSNSITPRNSPNIILINNNSNKNYSIIGNSTIDIIINGNNFYSPNLTVSSNDGKLLNVSNLVIVNSTQIKYSVQNTINGIFNFSISDVGGTFTFNNAYTFYNSPTITNVNPNIGSSIGGTEIILTGTNLIDITSITCDDNNINSYNYTSEKIIFKTLSKSTNNTPIISINVMGVIISTTSFSYVLPPTIINTDSSVSGQLIINGTNFTNTLEVFINNIPVSSSNITITDSTQIIINNYVYNANYAIQIQTVGGIVEFINQSSSGTSTYWDSTIESMTSDNIDAIEP